MSVYFLFFFFHMCIPVEFLKDSVMEEKKKLPVFKNGYPSLHFQCWLLID